MSYQQSVQKFMTASPHTINGNVGLETAKDMMTKHGVRHLPVQVAGHLVGIVSERDLLLGRALDKTGTLTVEEVMTPEPYSVSPETPLREVVEKMATNRYGCAVVREGNGKVVGIFTAIDAMRVISENLNISPRKAADSKGVVA